MELFSEYDYERDVLSKSKFDELSEEDTAKLVKFRDEHMKTYQDNHKKLDDWGKHADTMLSGQYHYDPDGKLVKFDHNASMAFLSSKTEPGILPGMVKSYCGEIMKIESFPKIQSYDVTLILDNEQKLNEEADRLKIIEENSQAAQAAQMAAQQGQQGAQQGVAPQQAPQQQEVPLVANPAEEQLRLVKALDNAMFYMYDTVMTRDIKAEVIADRIKFGIGIVKIISAGTSTRATAKDIVVTNVDPRNIYWDPSLKMGDCDVIVEVKKFNISQLESLNNIYQKRYDDKIEEVEGIGGKRTPVKDEVSYYEMYMRFLDDISAAPVVKKVVFIDDTLVDIIETGAQSLPYVDFTSYSPKATSKPWEYSPLFWVRDSYTNFISIETAMRKIVSFSIYPQFEIAAAINNSLSDIALQLATPGAVVSVENIGAVRMIDRGAMLTILKDQSDYHKQAMYEIFSLNKTNMGQSGGSMQKTGGMEIIMEAANGPLLADIPFLDRFTRNIGDKLIDLMLHCMDELIYFEQNEFLEPIIKRIETGKIEKSDLIFVSTKTGTQQVDEDKAYNALAATLQGYLGNPVLFEKQIQLTQYLMIQMTPLPEFYKRQYQTMATTMNEYIQRKQEQAMAIGVITGAEASRKLSEDENVQNLRNVGNLQ